MKAFRLFFLLPFCWHLSNTEIIARQLVEQQTKNRSKETAAFAAEGLNSQNLGTATMKILQDGSEEHNTTSTIRVILLTGTAPDATVNYFRNLLSTHGILFSEVTANLIPNTNLRDAVIIAGFSSEPTEYSSVARTIIDAVAQGSWLIAEAFGRFIPAYAGVGSVSIGSWFPAVQDKYAYVRRIVNSPLFEGIPSWDPPQQPDRPEQYINYIINTAFITTANYTPPSLGVDTLSYLVLAITYGWNGQNTNTEYCQEWGGCTSERAVFQVDAFIIHHGAGRIFTYHPAPVIPNVHTYGPILGSFYLNFIRWAQSPRIEQVSPTSNVLNVSKSTNITITFNSDIDLATLTNSTIKVNGSQSGLHTGNIIYNGQTQTVTFDPDRDFTVGEAVNVTLATGIRNTSGNSMLSPYNWSFTIAVNRGSGAFAQSSTVGIDTSFFVITGDLDGDVDLDLAVSNAQSKTITILKNSGNGNFTITSTLKVADEPSRMAVGDFDSDGDLDLAVPHSPYQRLGAVSIFKNNGNGSFPDTLNLSVGYSPYSVSTGDFDGDGDLDLAVALNGSYGGANSGVLILMNNGDGSFTKTPIVNVDGCEFPLNTGDWDGDGDLDLAVPTHCQFGISILMNDGSGTFTPRPPVNAGNYPSAVAVGDFDGDRDLDLVVPNRNDASSANSTVSILLNDGKGNFTRTSTSGVGVHPNWVTAGDIDDDGDLDLAVSNGGGQNAPELISILQNNGRGSFNQISTLPANDPGSVTMGDFDGDGDLDLAVSNGGNVSVYLNRNDIIGNTPIGWYPLDSGTTEGLAAVHFPDAQTGYVVGNNGIILKTTDAGSNWKKLNSPTTDHLWGVYFTASNTGCAVGGISHQRFIIFKTTDGGSTWELKSSGTGNTLTDVYFVDANIGYAVGGGVGGSIMILKTTDGGNTWNPKNFKTTEFNDLFLSKVYFIDATTGYAVGNEYQGGKSIILKTTNGGDNWIAEIRNDYALASVYFSDINTGYIVGQYDVILKTTDAGSHWNQQSSGTLENLFSVHFTDANTGYAVGGSYSFTNTNAVILNTTNGGSKWNLKYSAIDYQLQNVFFTNANIGYAVGSSGKILKTISGSASSATTNSATNVGATFATLNGTVNPNGLSTRVKFQYGTTTSYGNEIPATPSPVTDTSAVPVSASLIGLTSDTTYYYRMVATNSAGTQYGADQVFTTLPAYPSTLTLNTTVNFPSHTRASDYKGTDYRIVGLPGTNYQSIKDFLSGEPNKDWQVFWDNGAAKDFFVEFDGSSTFQFSVGRAFWIIQKGTLSINTTVPSTPLNAAQEIELPLPNSGWNLITNPFTTSVAWSKIQSANNVTEPIYAFTGSFSRAASFDPYFGYYFFNATNLTKLIIPYSLYFSSTPAAEVDPVIWRVNIAFASGEFSDKSTSFGIAHDASPGLDRLDFRKPRAIATTPTVCFQRPSWNEHYSTFATDIRPEIETSESWDFDVRTAKREASQLAFSGISKISNQFEVYLIDEGRVRTINLREDSLYRFTPAAELSKFNVVVGKKEAMQEKLNSVTLPKAFALGPNYPNPFNPTTTIPVAIPTASEAKLKIYNLLGAEVKTLYDGTIEAGRYWFNWDGRNEAGSQVATGIYLYRLTTNKRVNLLGKMILMR